LAELRRRKHAVLSGADAGADAQNFLSAATGIALAVALIRGLFPFLDAHHRQFLGRCDALHALCPAAICVVYTLFLVWQGIPQTLGGLCRRHDAGGAKQTIAVGPVASQVAIKMLGTNGGGFFNANAAHPFETRPHCRTSCR